ncbi:hypothetical protein BH24ACT26_BH24ACT26_21610 [soil metagenome]
MPEFRWITQDAAADDSKPTPVFATQEEAEAWMGREWAALLEDGAEFVTLLSDGKVLYRMGLREE